MYAWRRARRGSEGAAEMQRGAPRPGPPPHAVWASALSPCLGRQGAAQICMSARGADMTGMTHPAHQVLETKDFQAAANVIERLFTIDIQQNDETGPEERV